MSRQESQLDFKTEKRSPSLKSPKEEEKDFKDLDDFEKEKILKSTDFLHFLDQSSKIVQRTLAEPYDVTIDYSKNNSTS